jgi:2-desacetyl-2-hydroxyethyl bacteriochlorophyllide A dehydrogenase
LTAKRIAFISAGKAVLEEFELGPVKSHEVLVEMEYTTVSAGTERDVLMGSVNTGAGGKFPRYLGYSGVGVIKEIGSDVKDLQPGDRVVTYRQCRHASYCILDAREPSYLIKIEHEALPSEHAAFTVIAGFSIAAVRKTRLELGESALVLGTGILGMFAIQLCKAAGAIPVIAVDLLEDRRRLALKMGADFALDPTQADFSARVNALTRGKGVNAIIEVTGKSDALNTALDIAAPRGRIALLGCTRVSDTYIDFYSKVHKPGVEIIGAHSDARPLYESSPYYWTKRDDCVAIMDLMTGGRLDMTNIISEIHTPEDAPDVYARLAENNNLPVGVLFNWKAARFF